MTPIWINKCGHIHSYSQSIGFATLINFNENNVCFRCSLGYLANETGTAKVVRSWLGAK